MISSTLSTKGRRLAPAALLAVAALLSITVQAQAFDIMEATIPGIHAAFMSGELSCVELVQGYLRRIEAYDKQGPALNAIQTVNPQALEEAARLDAAFAESGLVGPLHCIPVLVKDQVEVAGMPTTYGSAIFKDFISDRDATIVKRMKEAGAIILAKTNMGEFASGYVGSAFGFCRNPYDPARNPSSSSCGTGAAVAANFGAVGIAEDTGGSTRGPASHTSTVGLRPTTPLISRYGMMPATPTRDTLGPLTRTVTDAAILTSVIAGYDPNDPLTAYSVGNVPDTYTAFLDPDGLRGARIGVIREPMSSDADPTRPDYAAIQAIVDQAVSDMRALGAEVIDPLIIPNLMELMDVGGGSSETEAAINAYLAQLPNAPVRSFREIAVSDLVAPVRRSGLINALNRSTSDPDYLRSLAKREELRQVILQVMAEYQLDAIVYPTFSHEPAVIPDDILTRTSGGGTPGSNRSLSPLIGFPALTVPAGFTPAGLPVGIDILGRPFTEGMLFKFGYAYEQATQHRRPPAYTPPLPDGR